MSGPHATPPVLDSPTMTVTALNDHLLYFFDGRNPAIPRYAQDFNWLDDAAMKLGVGTYVVHQGREALVYDTFTTPTQARAVRKYLEDLGIKHVTVTLSHWHLDHVGGLAAWADVPIVATAKTKEMLASRADLIKHGTDPLWGPPPIDPLILPTETFEGPHTFHVGDIVVEARNVDIHSKDTEVLYLPADHTLLSGDTLEDELTYMVEFESLPDHVKNLRVMRQWEVTTLYPNHGDPGVIRNGGYNKTLIAATINYVSAMLAHAHDADFLTLPMETFVGDSLAKGWVHPFEPYRDVHKQNLQGVSGYWKDRPLPSLE
jgi:glyoxylase-like metal-dependent hydrolase (beta-lactamase superfamily II)